MKPTQTQVSFFAYLSKRYYQSADNLLAKALTHSLGICSSAAYKRMNGTVLLDYAELYCLLQQYDEAPIDILFPHLKNCPHQFKKLYIKTFATQL
jgi:hypothetical protein